MVVTLNVRDFRRLIRPDGSSVIGLSPTMKKEDVDQKLTALLRRLKPRHLTGHYFKLDRDSRIADVMH